MCIRDRGGLGREDQPNEHAGLQRECDQRCEEGPEWGEELMHAWGSVVVSLGVADAGCGSPGGTPRARLGPLGLSGFVVEELSQFVELFGGQAVVFDEVGGGGAGVAAEDAI